MTLGRMGRAPRLAAVLALAAALLALLAGCGPPSAASRGPAASPTPDGADYRDAKLGFSLRLPDGWRATPYPGLRGGPHNTDVLLADPADPASVIAIAVTRGTAMPAAFASRGAPSARIGQYPAFVADTTLRQGRVPCLVRIFLAGSDYALAEWCAMDAAGRAAEFDALLATYHPAPDGFAGTAGTPPPPEGCADAQRDRGYSAPQSWGRELAAPTATNPAGGWNGTGLGVFVCSNTGSGDPYLFQCTELVNRFLTERWGLGHIPGSAGRYFDYYQDGAPHPGAVRDLPAGSYALSDDASQGASAFMPRPGDLLIFQDVTDARVGWRSGLTSSPGHVAIVTGTDAAHVYVAQENYNDRRYFMALPMVAVAGGYRVTDLSGIPNRIVRGWIRLTPLA